jgi:phenylacetate-CoA ligase
MLAKSEWLLREDLEAMQLVKLQELITHCSERVPYYKTLFKKIGFKPEHLKTLADIRNIPPISKAELREYFEQLCAINSTEYKPEECTSGGSTGEPVKFLLDRKSLIMEKACLNRHWLKSGYKQGEPNVNLRGLRLTLKPGRYWLNDQGENCLYLSSYHLTPVNIGAYVEAFNTYKPTLLNTYPSNGAYFATLIEESGLKVNPLRSIVCSSETLYSYQRERMEEVFGCKVWDYYGLTELVGNAGECEAHDGYHMAMEMGLFEVLCAGDRPAEEGEVGEIVATALNNFSMPFLRYLTGDLAEFTDQPCSCGRGLTMIKRIQGRAMEFIETPSGSRLTVTALNVHGGTWTNVRQFQYVQMAPDRVALRVIKSDGYSDSDERRILSQMSQRFGDEIKLEMDYVTEIPKTPRGKTPIIIKELEGN